MLVKKTQKLFAALPLLGLNSFVDSYYAWDFNHPVSRERAYTTQASHTDAARINLAMVSGSFETERTRGVLSLQWGDSVDANYVAETKKGDTVKYLQEAYAGYKLSESVWMDAGIYLGHISNESWVSKQNWSYTRSLHSEYTPYYSSGVRFTGSNWQIHLMNGWQRINEENQGKAIGTQYTWGPAFGTITYNTFVGHETFGNRHTSGLRTYQDLLLEIPGKHVSWKGALDLGTQNVPGCDQALLWGGGSSQWHWIYSEKFAQAARLEYFHDERGMVTGKDFRVVGTSSNIDFQLNRFALWRLELKHLMAAQKIYPNHSRQDTLLAFSLGLSL